MNATNTPEVRRPIGRADVDHLLAAHPSQNDSGYIPYPYSGAPETERAAQRAADRERLSSDPAFERITAAAAWCRTRLMPRLTVGVDCPDSYGLKHIAEEEIGYTTNGEFIAGLLLAGFVMETRPGLNPMFAVSRKSPALRGRS